jgi:3-phenylpropionate/trans-cinnamate dioxygenase ferredoxin reductase subunit
MNPYKYLIIGGGMTADAAIKGIREIDPAGTIGLVSLEPNPPYNRPPLTKGLWKGKPFDSIWRHTPSLGVTLRLAHRIVSLDAGSLVATDDQGEQYHGEKLLLATGGTPRRLSFGEDEIIYYRRLEDYQRLADMTGTGKSFIVIGGGFIGQEIAAALALNGKKVTMLFPEDSLGARLFPHDLSVFLNRFYREKGVRLVRAEQAGGISSRRGRPVLETLSGKSLVADGLVAGIGIEPNTGLARTAGLTVGNGISVNDYLLTSHPNIYAAGDVAEFFNPALGKRLRLEHEDNANSMGRQAGRNMAGASETFHYLPFFYSDLFELGYEAVGELDSRLETAADWAEPFKKGIVYYFRDDRVCGVLLWNVWNKVPAARALIAQPGPFRAQDLKAINPPDWRLTFD